MGVVQNEKNNSKHLKIILQRGGEDDESER